MKPPRRSRRWPLAPLIYLAAMLLLLEDWLWDLGMRLMRRLAAWPPLHRLEMWICSLGPVAALFLLVLPATLLFPVKLLALMAMAHGHPLTGLLVIVLAKLAGAAAVARLFLLTRPVLMTLVWFAALLDWFLALKARWIERLQATAAWRGMRALAKSAGRRWRHGWRRRAAAARARGGWLFRLRRLIWRAKARRRGRR